MFCIRVPSATITHTHGDTHTRIHVGQPIKPFSNALWWVLCHPPDPRISLVDLNEPRGVHLPLLPTTSQTTNKTQGCSIQIGRCSLDIAAQAETCRNLKGRWLDAEQEVVAEAVGVGMGGWPGDRWERTCCQSGRRSTESTADCSEVLLCLLERGELSS